MLPKGGISAERVWKRFRADPQRRLLRDELERRVRRWRRNEGVQTWRWALRDVTLLVDPGEAVGIVGVNGSGKSTLLKILSRVMYPYAGQVDVAGRMAALIEIRAGIHPDLTGEENIFLYGSLLGLSRAHVARQFDEIVDFAELRHAIRGQVKFYSSGMQMRLGFAVAAFLEPDILLVDEVLAVGDAAFQQKCLERMRMLLGQGVTLVFVSHDLGTVQATCKRALWLDEGRVRAAGPVGDVLGSYGRYIDDLVHPAVPSADIAHVRGLTIQGTGGPVRTEGALHLGFVLQSDVPRMATIHLGIADGIGVPVFILRRDLFLHPGDTQVRCTTSPLPLPGGRFVVWMGMADRDGRALFGWQAIGTFDVVGPDLEAPPQGVAHSAPVYVGAHWDVTAP